MQTLYQSLVTVNPVTLIVQICNLFLQLFLFRRLFFNKVQAVLEQRRSMLERERSEAETAQTQARELKARYTQELSQAQAQADSILSQAQQEAAAQSLAILQQARQQAAQIRSKAALEIAREKEQAVAEVKVEIADLALAIAGKVIGQSLDEPGREQIVDRFLSDLGSQA